MIRVSALQKSYGPVRAVDDVSFSIDAGEVVGFLGPNGAGKSTTMRILCGYLAADAGEVEVDGHRVDPDSRGGKHAIGYLPESNPLHDRMRVADLLDFVGRVRGLGKPARREALQRVVDLCGLAGWTNRRIGTLSKGYRQRVGLAQALLTDPPVLVLDEPTNGLDPTEVARMRLLIEELGRTKTILLSTHVLTEVQAICRRVVILSRGKVVADGSPLDLAAAEREQLRVSLRPLEQSAESVAEELQRIPGVVELRSLGADDEGTIGFALEVNDRRTTALRLSRLVHARGWDLLELAHELPTLEQVFLRRTESTEAAGTSSSAKLQGQPKP
ncbi:MAG: ABC-2 type transport system ATP-binding protein [Planctomycetota bacterium]|jgi:ABC-2 type transport system ATP-binding protein